MAAHICVSSASAATVTYSLELSVPNTFTVTAQASLGDNGGIATYGIPLTEPILTLDHRTPHTFAAGNFQSAGFTNIRSADGSASISGSQALTTPNLIYGFGQRPATGPPRASLRWAPRIPRQMPPSWLRW